MADSIKVLRVKRLIDGTGANPIEDNPVVVVKGSKILDVGPESRVDIPQTTVTEINYPELTILPGLIDDHLHLGLPADGRTYEQVMEDSDSLMLLTAANNAKKALNAGLTTIVECGFRNRTIFDLKEASMRGIVEAPRLFICGRSLTMTGGHFWFCNAEMDGPDEIRKGVRGILKEGADFIKVMASGGGTAISDRRRASFSVEELKVFVEEAQRFGVTTKVHCHPISAINNAIEAGVHCIEHCSFIDLDGERSFNEAAVRQIIEKGIYVDVTLPVGYRYFEMLLEKEKHGSLSIKETRILKNSKTVWEQKFDQFRKMHQMGVKLLAGSDGGCSFLQPDDFVLTLELMVQKGGMTPRDAITTATQTNAEAIQLHHSIGSLERGKEADMIAVRGNPFEDISVLRNVEMVMLAGKIVR
jgi:imidazolonepropionase-like amidohydrolase